jgi:hypothetical protein
MMPVILDMMGKHTGLKLMKMTLTHHDTSKLLPLNGENPIYFNAFLM